MQKTCTKCNQTKDIACFTRRRKESNTPQWESRCNSCRNKANMTMPSYQTRLMGVYKKNLSDEERKKNKLKCNKKWRENNKDKWSYLNRVNRHRRRALGALSLTEWEEKLNRLGRKCLACFSVEEITIDHKIPVAKGGNNDIGNLQPLCMTCNKKKFTKSIDYEFKVSFL